MSKNKISLSIITLILIILVFIGVKTRVSFVYENNLEYDWNNYKIFDMNVNDIYYDKVDKVENVITNSFIIAKVKMTDEKQILNQCVLSKVEVINIYKNETNKYIDEDNDLYIYEPISVQNNTSSIYTTYGYIPMIENNEYMVFLKPLKVPKDYKMSEKEEISFMYYNPIYGKKSVDDKLYYINNDNKELELNDIINYDVILKSDTIDIYNEFNQIINEYVKEKSSSL